MSSDETTVRLGPGLLGCVFLVFLTLKLCGVLQWSWWWVTAPLWIPAGIGVAALLVVLFVAIIVAVASPRIR